MNAVMLNLRWNFVEYNHAAYTMAGKKIAAVSFERKATPKEIPAPMIYFNRLWPTTNRYSDMSSQNVAMLSRNTCRWYVMLKGENEKITRASRPALALPLIRRTIR